MYRVAEIHEIGKAQSLILFQPIKNVIGVDDTDTMEYEPQDNFDE